MTGNISLFTYGGATVGFLLFAALLLAQLRARPLGRGLLFAVAATAIWAGAVAAGTLYVYPPITLIQVTELARNAGWLFFLLQLLGFQSGDDVWTWLGHRWLVPFLIAALVSLGVVALRPISKMLALNFVDVGDVILLLWLGLAIASLLLIEQVYRNASSDERWGVKFLCLGLGAMFTYDFFMYAEALLFRQMNALLWQARGAVAIVCLPWLVVGVGRSHSWKINMYVSRHVVFHTVTLMGAGLYLLCMAMIGYFIKFLGGSWGGVLQVSFFAVTAALLLTLLFSGTLRARLRVWLSKHFFSYRYDYRVEWLRFTEGLAALEKVPPGIIRTMATITLSPSGLLLNRGSGGQLNEFAAWEMVPPNSRDLGNLQAWIKESGWVIDLQERQLTPDLYADLQLPHWISESSKLWLIVPLFFQDELEGLLFLTRSDLKESINWEDRDLLKTAGRQAAALLAQQRASQGLVEARQFDAFNRLSAYVIHDLKNILAQQSLMVTNAQKHRENPAFIDDMISTVDNSVKRMQRLMDQMRSGMRTASPATVELGTLLEQVVQGRQEWAPKPKLKVDSPAIVTADRERLATVFGHLLQNAQEATPDDGEVTARLSMSNGMAIVVVTDTGCGMNQEFIQNRLFKPFESTKGLTGMGIGAFESREYIRLLGGEIIVNSDLGVGSQFSVSLPVAIDDAEIKSCELGTPIT